MVISNMTENRKLIHFNSRREKVLFWICVPIGILTLAALIWTEDVMEEIYPGHIGRLAIATLILIACVAFSPAVVIEGWMLWEIIRSGLSFPNIVLFLIICSYVNSILSRYGVFGMWILFRKR